jgi:SAM-dependent methyltransferase
MLRTAADPDILLGQMASLADATRLRLLRLLEQHEVGVAELCAVLRLPQSTVSRHLKVLGDQGWLQSRRQGTSHLYRMRLDELDAPARDLWRLARERIHDWATLAQDELRLQRVLAERPAEPADPFAARAPDWDRLRRQLYGTDFLLEAALALLPAGCVIADLGCGTGALAARLSGVAGRVLAVDNSPAMLAAARRRLGASQNIELIEADLAQLPLEDGLCDGALLVLVLTYVADPAAVLAEARRILRPGGRLVVVDLLAHDRHDFQRQMEQLRPGFPPDVLQQSLLEAGLTDVTVRTLPPEAGATGPALCLTTGRRGAEGGG